MLTRGRRRRIRPRSSSRCLGCPSSGARGTRRELMWTTSGALGTGGLETIRTRYCMLRRAGIEAATYRQGILRRVGKRGQGASAGRRRWTLDRMIPLRHWAAKSLLQRIMTRRKMLLLIYEQSSTVHVSNDNSIINLIPLAHLAPVTRASLRVSSRCMVSFVCASRFRVPRLLSRAHRPFV